MKVILWRSTIDASLYDDGAGTQPFYHWMHDSDEGQWIQAHFPRNSINVESHMDYQALQRHIRVYIESEPSATLTAYLLRFRHSA